jgi:hypothetical protein
MTTTPIESPDDGRSFTLTFTEGDSRYRLTAPADLLDDECGADAGAETRRAWVESHLPGVMSALQARTEGGWAKAPYNRILVEEIS